MSIPHQREGAYTLDNVGNRTQRVDQLGTHTYGYDNLYRLTSATYPGIPLSTYTYDSNGNRLTYVNGAPQGGTTNYTYDAADRMTSVKKNGSTAYVYDNNGNLTGRGSDTLQWDGENRLTFTNFGGTTSSFLYNGDGLRDSRSLAAGVTFFTWDVSSSVPQELYDGTLSYVYGIGRVSQVAAAGTTFYYLPDGLGSTMAPSDRVLELRLRPADDCYQSRTDGLLVT